MPGPRFLAGDAVTLHTLEEADLPFAQRVLNDPAVRTGMGSSTPQTLPDEREWYEDLGDGEHHFVVCADGDPVGVAGIDEDPKPWGYAEVGYFLDPDHWGNGYATDAVRCLVRYGFEERRLNKVGADVYAPNEASQRLLEKAGFEREGVRRDHAFVDGEYVDLYEYGLLAAEWRD